MTLENYLKKLADMQSQINELVPDSLKENGERKMKEYIMIKETGNAPITVAELIRCKDCKHRPKIDEEDVKNDTVDGFSLEFPDDFKCPCRCADPYYNRMPEDDWYCGNGERKDE